MHIIYICIFSFFILTIELDNDRRAVETSFRSFTVDFYCKFDVDAKINKNHTFQQNKS